MVGGGDILFDFLASVTSIDERSRQIAHAFRPHEIEPIPRDFHRIAHRIVKAGVEELHFVDRCISNDRRPAREPVLTCLLKTFEDLIKSRLPSGKVDGDRKSVV